MAWFAYEELFSCLRPLHQTKPHDRNQLKGIYEGMCQGNVMRAEQIKEKSMNAAYVVISSYKMLGTKAMGLTIQQCLVATGTWFVPSIYN